jgi:hypothetical protein
MLSQVKYDCTQTILSVLLKQKRQDKEASATDFYYDRRWRADIAFVYICAGLKQCAGCGELCLRAAHLLDPT